MAFDPKALPSRSGLTARGAAVSLDNFDSKQLAQFCERSVSEQTRRAYRRVTKEFFAYLRNPHPAMITAAEVLSWRDHQLRAGKSEATVRFKLSVVRSMFEYLLLAGYVSRNPALSKSVPPPALSEELCGRALTAKEATNLLAGPDQTKTDGARDYALLLTMLRTSLRVSEACSIRHSSIKRSHGRWVLKVKVKGGRYRSLPLPADVRAAIEHYLKLDSSRRAQLHCGGPDAFIFQPITNYRTLTFDKPLSTTMAWRLVRKWGEFTGVGKISPHDLRRTAITRALSKGLSLQQTQMMSGHKDPKTVMRYDHGRENLDQNAINFLDYTDT
jgi:integrase/recombinase XerD